MQFESIEEFGLPEAYVYLCNATAYAPNNYAPVYQLGKERIRKIVICCGAPEGSTDAGDLKHAIEPAENLRSSLAYRLDLDDEQDILILHGDPDRPGDWMKICDKIKQFAPDLPVVANLQGGTTQMSLGINDALNASSLVWLRVTVTKPPIRTAVTALFGNSHGEKIVSLGDAVEQIPQDLLFASRGLQHEPKGVAGLRSWYDENADLADRIWQRVSQSHRWARTLALWNKAIFHADSRAIERTGLDLTSLGLSDSQLSQIGRLFEAEKFPEQAVDGRITPGFFGPFVTGGWLEQAVCNHLRRHFKGKRNFAFTLGVPLRRLGMGEDEGEIDVLVQHGDNLHVIEVKTSATGKQVRARHRNQTSNNRQLVGGEMARAWLVMPMLDERHAYLDALKKSCALSQVELIVGVGAMKKLAAQIEQLSES